MIETDTYQKSLEKRERRATVCAFCVWVIVLAFCWVFSTTEQPVETMSLGELSVLLLMQIISLFVILLSIYKIGRGILNLYKHR